MTSRMTTKEIKMRVNALVSDHLAIDRDDDKLALDLIETLANIEHSIDENSSSKLIDIAASLSLRVVRANSKEVAYQFVTRQLLDDISKKPDLN